MPLRDGGLPALPGTDLAEAVRHEGELVGALSLKKRPGEGVSSADRRLVEELAGQAALLLANTRLRARLTDRLDERHLEVLVCRYVDDMSQDEIAEHLSTSRKTIGKRLARIRDEVIALRGAT